MVEKAIADKDRLGRLEVSSSLIVSDPHLGFRHATGAHQLSEGVDHLLKLMLMSLKSSTDQSIATRSLLHQTISMTRSQHTWPLFHES